ncbi:hypothetical protein ES703_29584 [subsurface metagenome]
MKRKKILLLFGSICLALVLVMLPLMSACKAEEEEETAAEAAAAAAAQAAAAAEAAAAAVEEAVGEAAKAAAVAAAEEAARVAAEAAAAAAAALEAAEAEEKIILSLQAIVAESDIKTIACHQFANEVFERTNGRIEIIVYPINRLVRDIDVPNALPARMIDISETQLSNWNYTPEAEVIQVKGLMQSTEQYHAVLDKFLEEFYREAWREAGAEFLGWLSLGCASHVTFRDGYVKTVEDFEGIKIRVQGKTTADQYRSVGALPTVLSAAEVYSGIQTGLVDGVSTSPVASIAFRWFEVAPYASNWSGLSVSDATHCLLMNQDAWNELSPADQDLLVEAAQHQTQWTREVAQGKLDTAFAQLVTLGEGVYDVPEAEVRRFNEIAGPYCFEEFKKTCPEKAQQLLDMIDALRTE